MGILKTTLGETGSISRADLLKDVLTIERNVFLPYVSCLVCLTPPREIKWLSDNSNGDPTTASGVAQRMFFILMGWPGKCLLPVQQKPVGIHQHQTNQDDKNSPFKRSEIELSLESEFQKSRPGPVYDT